jgi:hypothetical protein
MSAYVLCSSCKRHVRSGDVTCPFCNAAIEIDSGRAVEKRRGLSRAKVYALQAVALATGVTTAALAGGCSSSDSSTGSSGDGGSDTAQGGDGQTTDSGAGGDTAGGGDSAGGDTANADSGTGADSATDEADTNTDTGFCCPPYGCVFPHDGCVTRV